MRPGRSFRRISPSRSCTRIAATWFFVPNPPYKRGPTKKGGPAMPSAEELIRHLGLAPHPKEGGFFRETYRAGDALPASALAPRYQGMRSASTAIYYLLTPTTFSALHRLQTDAIFPFYLARPVRM